MSIIIIGKRGFIAQNLVKFFIKKKIKFLNISLKNFLKLDNKKFQNYKNIINCSINEKIIKSKYNQFHDYDKMISKKILNSNLRYIFLSTRKVYGKNIYADEKSKLYPRCNYSKNKAISENSCQKILNKRLVILRISNLIGYRRLNTKRLHKTFIDYFFINSKKNKINFNFNDYKDFLSIDQFCEIVLRICLKKEIFGIFNVSLGKKVFLIDLVHALLKHNSKNVSVIDNKKIKSDNFVLNNNKLLKKLKIDINPRKLIDYCHNLSKKKYL